MRIALGQVSPTRPWEAIMHSDDRARKPGRPKPAVTDEWQLGRLSTPKRRPVTQELLDVAEQRVIMSAGFVRLRGAVSPDCPFDCLMTVLSLTSLHSLARKTVTLS
jgi:hypothetical protein